MSSKRTTLFLATPLQLWTLNRERLLELRREPVEHDITRAQADEAIKESMRREREKAEA